MPTTPATEAPASEVEALAKVLGTTPLAVSLSPSGAKLAARAVLAAGYVSAAEVERLVAEAGAEALRDAAETQRWMVGTYRDQNLPGLKQRLAFADWLEDEADDLARAGSHDTGSERDQP